MTLKAGKKMTSTIHQNEKTESNLRRHARTELEAIHIRTGADVLAKRQSNIAQPFYKSCRRPGLDRPCKRIVTGPFTTIDILEGFSWAKRKPLKGVKCDFPMLSTCTEGLVRTCG